MRRGEVACVNTAPPCGLHCRMTFTTDRTRCDDKKAAHLQPDDVLIRRGGGGGGIGSSGMTRTRLTQHFSSENSMTEILMMDV